MSNEQQTALVTGASSGIGREYARVLAQKGFTLILTARRVDRLKDLARELEQDFGTTSYIFPHDLGAPETPLRLVQQIREAGLEVDFLLNNAGYTVPGAFDAADWNAHEEMMRVMLHAPTELVHLFARQMRARQRGYIVNVSSLAGLLPGVPNGTLYAPVKGFLVKFSQGLFGEYEKHGVHVQALCPGFTKSEFHDVAGNREKMNQLPKYMWLDGRDVCTESLERVLVNKGPVFIPGLYYKLLIAIVRRLPMNTAMRMISKHDRNAKSLDKYTTSSSDTPG